MVEEELFRLGDKNCKAKGVREIRICGLAVDLRPPQGGWISGAYMNKCSSCGERFIGAKEAYQCASCAYKGEE